MSTEKLGRAVRASVLEHTLLGVCNTLSRVFSEKSGVCGRRILVLPVSNPDNLEAALQARAAENPTGQADIYSLPVIGVTFTDASLDNPEGALNKTAMMRVGQSLGVEDHGQYFTVFRGAPVRATYTVTFLTDDMQTSIRMVDAWFAYTQWVFQLRLRDTKKAMRIKLTPDTTLSAPQRLQNSAQSEQFRMTANLAASTYSGSLWKIPSIAKSTLQTLVGGKSLETSLAEGGFEIVDALDRLSATNIDVPNEVGNTELGVFEDDQ